MEYNGKTKAIPKAAQLDQFSEAGPRRLRSWQFAGVLLGLNHEALRKPRIGERNGNTAAIWNNK